MPGKTIYRGEGLVKRWGDSSSALRTVTIQLQEDEPLSRHPFFGFDGRRVAVVVVELGETDSGPGLHLGPDKAAGGVSTRKDEAGAIPVPAPPTAPKPNSTRAVMMAKDAEFQRWARVTTEAQAEAHIKTYCGVTSKAYLNVEPANVIFDRLRREFNSWRLAQ